MKYSDSYETEYPLSLDELLEAFEHASRYNNGIYYYYDKDGHRFIHDDNLELPENSVPFINAYDERVKIIEEIFNSSAEWKARKNVYLNGIKEHNGNAVESLIWNFDYCYDYNYEAEKLCPLFRKWAKKYNIEIDLYKYYRPCDYLNSTWICEKPYIKFSVNNKGETTGFLKTEDEKSIDFKVYFFDDNGVAFTTPDCKQNEIFDKALIYSNDGSVFQHHSLPRLKNGADFSIILDNYNCLKNIFAEQIKKPEYKRLDFKIVERNLIMYRVNKHSNRL